MEYITTNSSCDSGDPATNTMAYYYPPGLNPFLVDDKDSLSSAGSNNTGWTSSPELFTAYSASADSYCMSNFKLQAFWPDAPVAWFGAAEGQFKLRRVTSQEDALDKQIVHLVVTPDPIWKVI